MVERPEISEIILTFHYKNKKMRTIFIISVYILVFCSQVTAQVEDSVNFKTLEPYDFHLAYLTEDSAILFDVREFFEYRKTRIMDAVNLPSSGNLKLAADTLDSNLALFFYCTTGGRSKRVSKQFADEGFLKVYNLDGGITAWKKDGFPVEKKRIRKRK